MTSEKLNTPLCYLVLSGSIVYAVLLYFFYGIGYYWDIYCTCIRILSFITKPVVMRGLPILLRSTNSKQPA